MRNVKAVVLIADGIPDGDNEKVFIDDVTIPDEEVRVCIGGNEARPVGTALLKKEGNNVVAEIRLCEEIPSALVPCVFGQYLGKTRNGNEVGIKISVSHIELADKNADSRIPALT